MFRRTLRGPKTVVAEGKPGPGERLWLDDANIENEVRRRTSDPALQECAIELDKRGATVIRGAIPSTICDELRTEFADFSRSAAAEGDTSLRSHHWRLSNFHLVSESALKIGTNEHLMEILDYLFGYRAGIYSSLTFQKSTEQDLHRDTPFFHTLPPGFFFGVWTALEDIHIDAGPLVYLPGGHRVQVPPVEFADSLRGAGEDETFPSRLYSAWQAEVASRAEAAGSRLFSPTLSKGDTMIWHPDLPHGGGKIVNPSLTRTSIVFHCTPVNVPLYGPHEFFGLVEPQPISFIPTREYAGRSFVDHGQPQIFSDSNPQEL